MYEIVLREGGPTDIVTYVDGVLLAELLFTSAQRFPKEVLIHRATEVDAGFDPVVLATMLGALGRFRDDDIPIDGERLHQLRSFVEQWQEELRAEGA